MENPDADRQAIEDNIIRHIRFAWWITKTTDTHSEYILLRFFNGSNGFAKAPQYYVKSTLRLLLIFGFLYAAILPEQLFFQFMHDFLVYSWSIYNVDTA